MTLQYVIRFYFIEDEGIELAIRSINFNEVFGSPPVNDPIKCLPFGWPSNTINIQYDLLLYRFIKGWEINVYEVSIESLS